MEPNQIRARRSESAVDAYGNDHQESNLIDLLTDAMHLCDFSGMDFHFLLAQACRHYINELNDNQQDERRIIL